MEKTLRELADKAHNVGGTNSEPGPRVEAYLRWVPESIRMLQYVLPMAEIDRLISTQRYWAVLGLQTAYRSAASLVDVELEIRERELRAEADDLKSRRNQWGGNAAVAVLDTSILMHQIENLAHFSWNEMLDVRWSHPIMLAVPMMVIDELDNLKDRGTRDRQKSAAAALKLLEDWFPTPEDSRRLIAENGAVAPWTSSTDIRIYPDPLRHVRQTVPDAEIVLRATSLKPFASQVSMVTNDTNMLTRARAAGLRAMRPRMAKANP